MPQDPDREYDKTSLKVTTYPGVHRDYAAHFFRWGFISTRLIEQQKTRVLDIGCGVDCPLVKVFSSRLLYVPKSYLGVDMNNFKPPFNYKWTKFMPKFNFAERHRELPAGSFDLITCLEVVEHMRVSSVKKLLAGANRLLVPGGKLVLSTPVANGRPAKNHINEMTIDQLSRLIYNAGFLVDKRFGTFMNVNELKKVAGPAENAIAQKLREYYSDEVISCFLAPLHPDNARNNIWICSLGEDELDDIL